jgi:hypothetical protein
MLDGGTVLCEELWDYTGVDASSESLAQKFELDPTGFEAIVFLACAFFFGVTVGRGRVRRERRSQRLVCSDPSFEDVAD